MELRTDRPLTRRENQRVRRALLLQGFVPRVEERGARPVSDDLDDALAIWEDTAARDATQFEDMASAHRRYRKRSGTIEAVTLPADRDMPRGDATREKWEAFHRNHTRGAGGFDPCSILRRAS